MTPLVLAIDQSRQVAELVEDYLGDAGYRVLAAVGGSEALQLARSSPPDVVLIDLVSEPRQGLEVLERLRAEPELADIPAIVITKATARQEIASALRHGAHDFIHNPFDAFELEARVSAALRVKQVTDTLRHINRQLESEARTDALTGIGNRRQGLRELERMLALGQRAGHSVSVLAIDLDHFKAVNDEHGHDAGDHVLVETATRLQRAVRASDTLVRWGGEEFLAILPGTSAVGAPFAAERLRRAVSSQPIPLPDGAAVTVTASVGYTSWTNQSAEQLVKEADTGLYAAKAAGRDRISGAS